MKSKLIALSLVLFAAVGSIARDGSSPCSHIQSPAARLVISEYGTLREILDVKGRSLFGKLEQDGFKVVYSTDGKPRSVSAVGSGPAKGLLPGKVNVEGKFASVTVTTEDKLLAIKTIFRLDGAGKKLTIQRIIKNTSRQKLSIMETKQYLPRVLIGAKKSSSGPGQANQFLPQVFIGALNFSPEPGSSWDSCGRLSAWKDWDCLDGDCIDPPAGCMAAQCLNSSVVAETIIVDGGGVVLDWCPCRAPRAPAEEECCCTPGDSAREKCDCCPPGQAANETSTVARVDL